MLAIIIGTLQLQNIFDKRTAITHPHNFIIEFLAESGLIGFCIIAFIVFIIVRTVIKNRDTLSNIQKMSVMSLAIFAFNTNIYGVITPQYMSQSNIFVLVFVILSTLPQGTILSYLKLNKILLLCFALLLSIHCLTIFTMSKNYIKILENNKIDCNYSA